MHEDHHGHSTAAWAGVAVMLVAAVIACWGVLLGPDFLLWLGLGLGVVGALVWYGMERAGYGSRQHQDSTDDTDDTDTRGSSRGSSPASSHASRASSPGSSESVRLQETPQSQDLTDSPEAGQSPRSEHTRRPRS